MDNWILRGPKTLVKENQEKLSLGPGQVKVRITHVLLSSYDALCYTGAKKILYPKTLGRIAVGMITDVGDGCYGVKKKQRVYLNAVRPCGKCYACKSGNRSECPSPVVVIRDFDGFLCDFVVCDYNDVAVIPESVDYMHALCIEHVALAENIFDRLNLSVGNKVAIVGAGFLGMILTQIALYHKLVPIVIDNYPENIERMKRCGAYYAFPADDMLDANINDATSGTLCDAAIYTSGTKLPASVPASVLARNKDLVLAGFSAVNFMMDTEHIYEKNLRVYAVSDGFGYTVSAINMLVHGAIELKNFEKDVLKDFDPSALLQERADKGNRFAKMTVLKFVM